MFERFTERAKKALSFARQEAQRLQHENIGTEHVLLGILLEGGGVAAKVLLNLNADFKAVRREIESLTAPSDPPVVMLGQYPFTPRARRAIDLAIEAADELGHDVVGTEHLLMGLLKETEGTAARALIRLGLNPEEVRDMVLDVLGAAATEEEMALARSAGDTRLSARARAYLSLTDRPELQEAVLTLLREGRSIALVGPRYVGKTSLVFALSRANAGGFAYTSLDYRMFDEFFPARRSLPAAPECVRLVPEGELVTASRTPIADVLDEQRRRGERLILEFRDGGFEAYAARHPDFARDLTRVDVPPPGPEECRRLLASAVPRLKETMRLALSDSVLQESDALARARWPKMVAPWATLIALWKAASIQNDSAGRGDVQRLEADIAALDKSPNPQDRSTAAALRAHVEGLRGAGGDLSLESVRQAIGELADRPGLL